MSKDMNILNEINRLVRENICRTGWVTKKAFNIPVVLTENPSSYTNAVEHLLSIPKEYTIEDTQQRNSGQADSQWHDILVGGFLEGGKGLLGSAYMPFGVASKNPNRHLFKWYEDEKIRKTIEDLVKQKKKIRVFGNSYGGATIGRIAKDYQKIPFYALDPVSWKDRPKYIPDNLTVYLPEDSLGGKENIAVKLAPIIGGRWPILEKYKDRYKTYKGGHLEGVDNVVNEIIDSARSSKEEQNKTKSLYKHPSSDFFGRISL